METIKIDKDITVLCVTAKSFPDGVLEAFETLHKKFPSSPDRTFYGLSRMEEENQIVYKAAVEMKSPAEQKESGFETLIIRKGNYISETIHDFMTKVPEFEKTFQRLLEDPNIDPNGYCVEWHHPNDKDVRCMVRVVK